MNQDEWRDANMPPPTKEPEEIELTEERVVFLADYLRSKDLPAMVGLVMLLWHKYQGYRAIVDGIVGAEKARAKK